MVTSPASPRTDHTRRWPGLVQARSFLLTLFSIEVAVLVVTGIALFFVYRPSVAQSWSHLAGVRNRWDVARAVRFIHRLASSLAVWTAVVLAIVVAISGAGRRRWVGRAAGAEVGRSTFVRRRR